MSGNQTHLSNSNDSMTFAAVVTVLYSAIFAVAAYYLLSAFGIDAKFEFSAIGKEYQKQWFVMLINVYYVSIFGVFALVLIKFQGGRKLERHISGMILGNAGSINALEKSGIKRSGEGVKIGGVTLSRDRETGHAYILGLPGSGKTVLLNGIIKQILSRSDKLVIFDPKGDYTSWIDSPFVIFAPWDSRSVAWAIGRDIKTQALAAEAAASWIKIPKGSDPMWAEGARIIMTSLIISLQIKKGENWTFADLSEILKKTKEEIAKIAVDTWAASNGIVSFDGEGKLSKNANSYFTTMLSAVMFVHQCASAEKAFKTKFSFRDFLLRNDGVKTLILKADANYQSAVEGIFGLAMNLMAGVITSPAMPEIPAKEAGVFFIIDEFPQLGKAAGKAIKTIQEVGRSRGARVFLAAQDSSQFMSEFGREEGRVMTALQQTQIFCRLSNETAKEIAERGGKKMVMRAGASMSEKGGSESLSQQEINIISQSDLTRLAKSKDGVGIEAVMIVEGQPAKIVVTFVSIKQIRAQAVSNPHFENGLVDIPVNPGGGSGGGDSGSLAKQHFGDDDDDAMVFN